MATISGRLVKAIRHGLGMDQKQFAKQVGVNQQTISNWESLKDEQIPRSSERKIRKFLKANLGVRVGSEDIPGDLGDFFAGAIGGGVLGAILAGPAGAAAAVGEIAAAAAVVGGGAGFALGATTKAVLEAKCPWCQKLVPLGDIDVDAEYECPECERVFKFKVGLGRAVRVLS